MKIVLFLTVIGLAVLALDGVLVSEQINKLEQHDNCAMTPLLGNDGNTVWICARLTK